MVEISSSILSVNRGEESKAFFALEKAKTDYFHIDVMDGKFVKNNNLELMKNYALTVSHISNLGIDVHLMVENVEEYVEEYLDLNPQIITFHIEASKSEERTQKIIDLIKQNDSRVGLAISPDTDLENIKPYLKYIHLVLVMTVVPGLGGQKLIPETLEKVCELKKYIEENNIDIDIEVDGGINDITAKEATQAGANILVVGKYLITSDNLSETVNKLKGGK